MVNVDTTTDLEFMPEIGCWRRRAESEYQGKASDIYIVLPLGFDPSIKYPVLYVLPVTAGNGMEVNNGLAEILKGNFATIYQIICVYPLFERIPWYANHVENRLIRQEDYFTRVVVPYIEGRFRVLPGREGRWLLGFSKSGWGAFTLAFRHPGLFGYAAAWDSPWLLNGWNSGKQWGPYGIDEIFGSITHFGKYRPNKLAVESGGFFKDKCRLVLGGSHFFGTDPHNIFCESPHLEEMHAVLDAQGIPHRYRDDLKMPHEWNGGWLPPLLEELVGAARKTTHGLDLI